MAVSEEDMKIDAVWLDMIREMAKEDGATELTVYWNNGVMCYCAEWKGNSLRDQFLNREEFDFEEDDEASYLEEHFDESDYIEEFTLSL